MERKPKRTPAAVATVGRAASRERRRLREDDPAAPGEAAIRIASPAPGAARASGRVEVVEAYFDAEGRPIKRESLGAARVARAYDAKGNQVEEAYFNAEGKPTVRKDVGAARISWRYDDSGKRVEAAFYGADGAPIRRRAPDRP